jgi:hypothetical protein
MRFWLAVLLVVALVVGVGSAVADTDDPAGHAVVPGDVKVGRQIVLLLKDQDAWGVPSLENALIANGIAYDEMGSAQIPTLDLSPYAWVIIESNQPNAFYSTYNANLAMFETWINNGGLFELHGACYSSTNPRPTPPGGVTGGVDLQNDNYVDMPGHPTVQGVPNPYSGTYASHDSYTNFPGGANIICTVGTSPGGNVTLAEYSLGAGTVLLTGTTLEFAVNAGWDWAIMLDNMINYMWGLVPVELASLTATPVGENVIVRWTTLSEKDNLGFNLYRSLEEAGGWAVINEALIPGAGTTSAATDYSFLDTEVSDGVVYYYLLEDVDLSGHTTTHGPVSCVAGGAPSDSWGKVKASYR